MSYFLSLNGYPPFVIKTADKKGYLNAVCKADVVDTNAFVEYLANELVWSLEISLKAAKGITKAEGSGLKKEIDVWKRSKKNICSFNQNTANYFQSIGRFFDCFFSLTRI